MQTSNEKQKNPSSSDNPAAGSLCFAIDTKGGNQLPFKELTIKALITAAYLRYSDDQQKSTSIDDQLRMCHETLVRNSITSSHGSGIDFTFADVAITGGKKGINKRVQYADLRKLVRDGKVDVVVCDQLCRLARDAAEALDFFDEMRASGVRLLTSDGFDSNAPTSQLLFGIKAVFAQFFLEETRHRVKRGMNGGFKRGAMVTAIPYGYKIDFEKSGVEGHCCWMIEPIEAEEVKDVFQRRKDGASLNQLAAIKNARNIPTSRKTSGGSKTYWRASAVWRILQNPIYKGIYQVNFGPGEVGLEGGIQQRLIPDFALVSAADWDLCQSMGKGVGRPTVAASGAGITLTSKAGYGGGKHPLAGVFRCGVCGATLNCHHAKTDSGSLYCVQCEHATTVGIPGRKPLYVSVKGVLVMLKWLLDKVVYGEAVISFREKLRERLEGGHANELLTVQESLRKAQRTQDRLARLMREIGEDDAVLERQYLQAREEVMHLGQHVKELEAGLREINHEAIQKQIDVDLSAVLDSFLSDKTAPERTRAILKRVLPQILLREKTDRFTAIFEIHVKPGAILAEASSTQELAGESEVMMVRLTTSGPKRPTWTVEALEQSTAKTAG